jgi:hypothetical protein
MMDLPLQLIVLSIPSLAYVAVRRRRGEKWNQAFRKIGWQGSRPIYFLWSLGVTIIAGGLGWLVGSAAWFCSWQNSTSINLPPTPFTLAPCELQSLAYHRRADVCRLASWMVTLSLR